MLSPIGGHQLIRRLLVWRNFQWRNSLDDGSACSLPVAGAGPDAGEALREATPRSIIMTSAHACVSKFVGSGSGAYGKQAFCDSCETKISCHLAPCCEYDMCRNQQHVRCLNTSSCRISSTREQS